VETRALKQAVRRNLDRFPADFMFELTASETETLVSQTVIPTRGKLGGAVPMAFTEEGVAMLSSVLRSRRAVQVNTTCGDAVGWTALSVWETGERSGERESTLRSCAHSCACARC
jgi:hypothetical protein